MAYATDLKSVGRKTVSVRVRPSVPIFSIDKISFPRHDNQMSIRANSELIVAKFSEKHKQIAELQGEIRELELQMKALKTSDTIRVWCPAENKDFLYNFWQEAGKGKLTSEDGYAVATFTTGMPAGMPIAISIEFASKYLGPLALEAVNCALVLFKEKQ